MNLWLAEGLLIARLVKCAIRKGQQMGAQLAEHLELLVLVFQLLLYQL